MPFDGLNSHFLFSGDGHYSLFSFFSRVVGMVQYVYTSTNSLVDRMKNEAQAG